jgi:hypothetical protein
MPVKSFRLNFPEHRGQSAPSGHRRLYELQCRDERHRDRHVTLRLKDVPWDQALDIILQAKNLGLKKAGNVILIAP